MATTNTVTDQYILRPSIDDQMSAGVDKLSTKIGAFEKAADSAAQAATNVAQQAAAAGDRFSQASTQFDRYAKKYDDVTRAAMALKAAQEELADAQLAGQRAMAAGDATQAQYDATTAGLAQKISNLATKLGEARADAIAAAEAQAQWNGQIRGGSEVVSSFAEGVASAAAASRTANQSISTSTATVDKFATSHGNAAFAVRQAQVQFMQFASSVYGGESIMMAAVQQGHQLADVAFTTGTGFGALKDAVVGTFTTIGTWVANNPIVAGLAVVTAATVALGVAAESASRAQAEMRANLSATRDDYAAMAEAVRVASIDIAASSQLSRTEATKVAQTFAAMPGVAGSSLTQLGVMVAGLARALGDDLPAATKLATQALLDPAKAALQMASAEQPLRSMDAATLDMVLHLQQVGDRLGASALVMSALGKTSVTAAVQLTPLQEALRQLGETFTEPGVNGKSWAQEIGEAIGKAAAVAVLAINDVMTAIRDAIHWLRDNLPKGPSPDAWTSGTVNTPGPSPGDLAFPGGVGSSGGSSPTRSVTGLSGSQGGIAGDITIAGRVNNVDPDLLARLQQYEGAWDPATQTWKDNGSHIGAMQVSTATFAGMQSQPGNYPTVKGSDSLSNTSQNVNAGAAYLSYLIGKYGDLRIAILAYHDGETAMDRVLATGGTAINSKEAIAEADTVLSGYKGAGRTDSTVKVATNNASTYGPQPDKPYLTPEEENQRLARQGAIDLPSVLSNQKAIDDTVEKLKGLQAQRDLIANGPDAISPAGVSRMLDYDKAIDQVKVQLSDLQDPTRVSTLAMIDQSNAAGVLGDADRRLLQVNLEIAAQRRDNPAAPMSDEAASRKIAAAMADQAAGAELLRKQNELTISQQDQMTAAWAKGTDAANDATIQVAAYTTAIKYFPTADKDFVQHLKDIEAEMHRVADSAASEAMQKIATQSNEQAAATLRTAKAWDGSAQSLDHLNNLEKARADALANHLNPGEKGYAEAVANVTSALDAASNASRTLAQEQASVNAVSSAFSQAFSTIGDAITQAFVSGQGAAVNWGNVVKAVITQVIQKVAELAILNPLLNSVFGQNNATLGTAIAVLSGANSAGGTSASSSSGMGSLSGIGSLLSTGSTLSGYNAASLFSGIGSGSSGGSYLSQIANYQLWGGGVADISGASGAQIASATAPSGLMSENAVAGSLGTGQATGAGMTVGGAASALGAVAAGYGIGSYAGSLVAGNRKSGQQNAQIGAGVGAVVGSVFGPVGSVIGGLIGGVGGSLFGPQNATPYSDIGVVQTNGRLGVGTVNSQGEDIAAQTAAVQSQIDAMNTFLDQANIKITTMGNTVADRWTQANTVFRVGDTSKGVGPFPKYGSLDAGFGQFQFASDDTNLNDKISGKTFASSAELTTFIQQYQAAQTATTQILTTLDTAMKDLGVTTGSLPDAINQVNAAFATDKAGIDALIATNMLSADQVDKLTAAEATLADQRDKAIAAANAAATAQFVAIDLSENSRIMKAQATISGTPQDAQTAALYDFDIQAQAQKDALSKQLISVYGDTVTSSVGYAGQMAYLEKTLGVERLAIQTTYNNQITATTKAAYDQAQNAALSFLNSMRGYAQSLLTGDTSPLSPQQKFNAAQSSFNDISAKAAAGDAGAMGQVQQGATTLLTAARSYYGSSLAYVSVFNSVIAAIQKIGDLTPGSITNSFAALAAIPATTTIASQLSGLKNDVSAIPTRAQGGWIGNGTWNVDSVRAGLANGGGVMLAGGEFVVSAPSAARYRSILPDINAGTHANDNGTVVGEIRALRLQSGTVIAAETRQQTAALLEELQALRAEVKGLRADVARNGGKPGRLAA